MFAIIESGGKQYKVEKGTLIDIDERGKKSGDKMEFRNVLMFVDEGKVSVGSPYIDRARITGEVIGEVKAKKIVAFKKKKRKEYKKKIGHRQKYTRVMISEIAVSA